MRSTLCSVAILCLCSSGLSAQDAPLITRSGDRPLVSPDGTYVFQHVPHSDIIFEAQIAPRVIIVDTIGDAALRALNEAKAPAWGYQVSATPMVRLRMFDQASNPVRTPSYMPKGTFQLVRFRNASPMPDRESDAFNRGPIDAWLLDAIPFGHHSNGQDGCLFTSQVRGEDGECTDSMPTTSRQVNKTDGSFSTNYIEATASFWRMYLDSDGAAAGDYATRWEWRVGAGVQLNPEGYVGGSIDPELRKLYGPTRILVTAMAARRSVWRCGRASINSRFQYLTTAVNVPHLTGQVEGACFPSGWGGSGLFVRYYHGQDYYNLGFDESISRLQFGFTLQQERFLSFRIKSQ